ncbi:MAG TPA: response regulator [bacterium]|nr:response regulator [bacterium]
MKKRVLVVDDDKLFRQLLKFRLAKQGFDAVTAGNEKEFWEQAFNHKPDVILLDIWLNGKLGNEVYDLLLNFGFDSKVPVIFITGLTDDKLPRRAPDGGKYAYFPKPLDFEMLIQEINKLASRKEDYRGTSEARASHADGLRGSSKDSKQGGETMKAILRHLMMILAVSPLVFNPAFGFAKGKGGFSGSPPGFEKAQKKGWEGQVPPGWSQGEKKGWRESELPPGLQKKVPEKEES